MNTQTYAFSGLDPARVASFFNSTDDELAALGARRVIANDSGFPCRITLREAALGQTLILLPFEHQPAHSPYRASGPIFVTQGEPAAARLVNEVPEVVRSRLVSVRAYDANDCIVDAEVIEGKVIEPLIQRMFADNDVRYLHVHNARRGCYSCRVDRA